MSPRKSRSLSKQLKKSSNVTDDQVMWASLIKNFKHCPIIMTTTRGRRKSSLSSVFKPFSFLNCLFSFNVRTMRDPKLRTKVVVIELISKCRGIPIDIKTLHSSPILGRSLNNSNKIRPARTRKKAKDTCLHNNHVRCFLLSIAHVIKYNS